METIELAPKWAAVLDALLTAARTGHHDARQELDRMAQLADRYVAGRKANDALWDSLQAPPVDTEQMLVIAIRVMALDNIGHTPTETEAKAIVESLWYHEADSLTEAEVTEFARWFAGCNARERWAACAGEDITETGGDRIMVDHAPDGVDGGPVQVVVPPVADKVLNALFDALVKP
jgi:hypothetical protein